MLNSTIIESFKQKLTFVESLWFRSNISRTQEHQQTLLTAFVHKSYASDFVPSLTHNERLEFLGDSVLGACVSSLLYTTRPDREESQMTLYKIALVREEMLAQVARDIALWGQLFLSHGEENQGGRDKDAILADGLEALIGASYLLFWYQESYEFIASYIGRYLDKVIQKWGKSHKSRIQERAQAQGYPLPEYVTEAFDDSHWSAFKANIYINNTLYGSWTGKNKKKAQETAAKAALETLQNPN